MKHAEALLADHEEIARAAVREFAEAAVKEIAAARDYWERASLELPLPASERCETRRAILDSEGIGIIRKLAAALGVTLEKP